jgi:NDP-sugar pyrophosphorylase family protein
MSGVGRRFINAGYSKPKPLIEVDGKPIIEHVVNLFPGEAKFTFICNQVHLDETEMRSILTRIAPEGEIVAIAPHKKGPVFAVSEIYNLIDDDEEVIVNYCDFGTWWDYEDFLEHTRSREADGAVPSYKGFHPHMLGTTNYAFIRDEEQWMLQIQEKQPFTDNRMEEYASNGTYYFRRGALVKKYFTELMERDIHVNDEYYVSMIFNLLIEDGLKVSVYNIQHMLQWGTPQDLEEYQGWSDYFAQLVEPEIQMSVEKDSLNLIPMAGRGARFVQEGYTLPKPLIPISGKPMVVQAVDSLPPASKHRFVCLEEHLNDSLLKRELESSYENVEIVVLSKVTEGQAITCSVGLEGVSNTTPVLIAACDNSMLWSRKNYEKLLSEADVDAIVWGFKNHPSAARNPEMYGWIEVDETAKVTGVSVKKPISDTPENDYAIVGTFYFRSVELFNKALKNLVDKNIRVNNEFYVDSMVGELVSMGCNVKVFPVDDYICWGTPNDYRTYIYWQSFFHKADWHPYKLSEDRFMDADCIDELTKASYDFSQEHR